MFNVLIVDDEPMIREGLKTLISWKDYGFHIADVAASGKEALGKYKRNLFQLVIVDIRMPGMDGLELVQAIRQKDEYVHILIISGYADFKYAKKAMAWQVDGYILKPVDEDELIHYLKQLKTRLMKESEIVDWSEREDEHRCEQLVQSFLSGKYLESEWSNETVSRYGLQSDRYRILLIKLEGTNEKEHDTVTTMKPQLSLMFERAHQGVVFTKGPYLGILLKGSFPATCNDKRLNTELSKVITEKNLDYYAAVGEEVEQIKEIHRSYQTAVQLLNQRFFYFKGGILHAKTSPVFGEADRGDAGKTIDLNKAVDQLFYSIDVKNKETLEQVLDEYARFMVKQDCSEQTIKSNFIKLISALLNKLSRADPEIQPVVNEYSARMINIYKQPDLISLLHFTKSLLCDLIGSREADNINDEIKRMIDLIRRDYSENLKLETLALAFHYNSGYLGKLFKNFTGEYFNTYLDRVRIQKAKEFLEQGMKVYQVASRVGYSNSDYFYSKFKKYVGVSPSVYRKKHS